MNRKEIISQLTAVQNGEPAPFNSMYFEIRDDAIFVFIDNERQEITERRFLEAYRMKSDVLLFAQSSRKRVKKLVKDIGKSFVGSQKTIDGILTLYRKLDESNNDLSTLTDDELDELESFVKEVEG